MGFTSFCRYSSNIRAKQHALRRAMGYDAQIFCDHALCGADAPAGTGRKKEKFYINVEKRSLFLQLRSKLAAT
jgi:hypothetical protein